MLRLTVALIVVDGIDVTITIKFNVSSTDKTNVEASLKVGFWPFFSAQGEGGWNHAVENQDGQNLTIHSTCPQGNPNVLGVLVDPIDLVLGGS